MYLRTSTRGLLFLLVCLLLTLPALAQQGSTSLRGTVTDPQGAAVPNAKITIEDTQRGIHLETTSNNSGFYEFLQLPPGSYHLLIKASGFKTLSRENLVLLVSTPGTYNAALTVSSVAETVTVSISSVPLLNSSDATLGNAFDSKQVIELPSEGRNPVELLSLQGGVTYTGNQVDPASDSRGGAVNGARSDQTNITVDGVDNNDQLLGNAFTGVLRIPSDSISEFRVTTSSSNADSGRSSGAQIALTTKTGTNSFHGAAYEYNRTSLGQANDWFNKRAELASGEPNKPGQLIRNTFGGALGGPIKKDRLFFFANYEGQRSREATQVTRAVPSDDLRQGIVHYACDTVNDPNCNNSNTVIPVQNGIATLNPDAIAALDTGCANPTPPLVVTCPLGSGVSPAILALWNGQATLPNGQAIPAYPHANTNNSFGSDGLNILGYTFAAPAPTDLNTYLARLDYNITSSGTHRLFVRGDLMNDHSSQPAQFPGQPPASNSTNNSKGIFVGYNGSFSPNLLNSLRYGFIRQSVNSYGQNPYSYNGMWNLDDQVSFARTTLVNVPVHQIVDDLTSIKGRHTLQFGGNWRIIHNNRSSNAQNFFYGSPHPTFFAPDGTIAGSYQDLDPAILSDSGYPLVSGDFGGAYDAAITDVTGVLGSISAYYLQDNSGPISTGALVPRHFKANEAEFYALDSWRATSNFTLTFGLRYSLLQPPYESNGNQVISDPPLGQFFQQRGIAMNLGQTYAPNITFDLGGPANGKTGYWDWDYKDIAPRLAFAWSPGFSSGLLHSLFGSGGKTSIRGGYGMYYDHFGQGVVNTFDRQGSLGLTTFLENPAYVTTTNCAVRFASLTTIPDGLSCPLTPGGDPEPELPTAPAYGFPYTPPGEGNGSFAIGWGVDNRMKTPYAHAFDFSVSRELPRNFSIEASYVGRLGHRLLQEVDLAQPLNIKDPQSGMTYYQAAAMLAKDAYAGVPEDQIQPIPYWENLFASAAGPGGISGYATGIPADPTATQNIYDLYVSTGYSGIGALQYLDTYCFPGCSQLPGQSEPTPYNYFDPQFSSMFSWSTIGHSYYNALVLTLRRHSGPVQFDFNYTYSKSIDMNSNAERINEYENGAGTALAYNSQTVNAWMPFQLRAPSDYDLRHQINFNFLYQFPFGHGQRFGANSSTVTNLVFGGWELTGLGRWTSGYPFSISTYAFPTNYEQDSKSFLVGHVTTGSYYTDANGEPNAFKESELGTDNVAAQFRYAYPGESGQRNNLRGPGYFGVDLSLAKTFQITERQQLRFQWDTYNVTNAVRFDVGTLSNYLFYSSTLGEFTQTMTHPRVMQFGLRYTF